MNRRDFTRMTGLGALALNTMPTAATANMLVSKTGPDSNVPLGICNHSLRAWRPNVTQLLDFAIEHQLDSIQLNTLDPFESLENKHLTKIKKKAKAHDISVYVGIGSISEKSLRYSDKFGDAKTLIKEGIRVAKAMDSPILGVRIGLLEDRYTEGGIRPKMDEVIKLMKSFRQEMLDAGIKFAFENHAGDMRAEELKGLIEETGTDICGAFFDPGNAIYALEDPISAMKILGKYILCCSARDVVVWQVDDGAVFQWTAIGEGVMDYQSIASFLRDNCPGVPLHLEIISNSPRPLPYLKNEFWKGFPDLKAKDFMDFLNITQKGHPIDVAKAPPGMDKKSFEMENQKDELLRSIKYLRKECNVGRK